MTASHEHNHELVMTLAEGPDDASSPEVRRQLDECPVCLHDVALQRIALDSIAGATPVSLTDLEAARLRRSIHAALDHGSLDHAGPDVAAAEGHVPSTGEARRSSAGRAPVWYRFLGAAAVLVAVAIAVPTLGSLGSGGDDDSEGTDDVEVAAVLEQRVEDDIRMSAEDAPDDGMGGADLEMMDETTMAFAEEQATTGAAPMDGGEGIIVVSTLEDLRTLVADMDPEEARIVVDGEADAFGYATTDDDGCATAGSLVVGTPVESYTLGTVTLDTEGITVVVTVHRDPAGSTTLVAHDPDTCGVLQATS